MKHGNIVKKVVIGGVILVLIAGYYYRSRQANARKQLKPEKIKPISVRTVPVKKDTIEDFIYATGTIRAVKREYCYFETSGKVIFLKKVPDKTGSSKRREIREGDRVKKGELLAQVDPRNLEQDVKVAEAALRESTATFRQAEADYKRYKDLHEKKVTSKKDFEYYTLQLKKAIETVNTQKAKLRQAQVNLEHSKIYSPCDGIIAYMNVKVGTYYNGSPSNVNNESDVLNWIPFVILHDDEMELTANVPAAYVDLVKVGQEVYIFKKVYDLEDFGDYNKGIKKVLANVYSVNPAIDPGGRSVQVKIRTRIKDNLFRDGQYASCWIIIRKAEDALVIPYNTVMFEDNKPYCFIYENGVAKKRVLKLGIQGLDNVQILSGLEDGDKVISEGNFRLVNDTPVAEVKDGA